MEPSLFETSINAEPYQVRIQQFIALLQVDERNCWFQQESSTAHTAASSVEILHEFFGQNIISKGVWPPRSPDLKSPDFFLWSYLKDNVYQRNQQVSKKLYERMLRKVVRNVVIRVNECTEMNGHHFQHLL
jgi:hypothetical protein